MTRMHEFDALRGIAALAVVIAHLNNYRPAGTVDPLDLPFAFLYGFLANGHFAVMIFFAISGFVLSYPYFAGAKDERNLVIDALNRLPRLLIPVFLTGLLCFLLQRGAIALTGGETLAAFAKPEWAGLWNVERWDFSGLVEFLLGGVFVFFSDAHTINVNLWTMPIEFAFSFVVFAVAAWQIKRPLFAVLLLALAVLLISTWRAAPVELLIKLISGSVFLLGIAASLWSATLKRVFAGGTILPVGMMVVGLFLAQVLHPSDLHYLVANALALCAIVLFFVGFCAWPAARRYLTGGFWRYLGEVSFALYLVHGSVLYFVFQLGASFFDDYTNTTYFILSGVALIASFMLSFVIARYVELPAVGVIRRWLGQRMPRATHA